jgi:hypothetical protein
MTIAIVNAQRNNVAAKPMKKRRAGRLPKKPPAAKLPKNRLLKKLPAVSNRPCRKKLNRHAS